MVDISVANRGLYDTPVMRPAKAKALRCHEMLFALLGVRLVSRISGGVEPGVQNVNEQWDAALAGN
jgi:hypothetical protein